MEIQRRKKDGLTILAVTGNVAQEDTALLRDELSKAVEVKCPKILLDLSQMHYICSTALTVLVKAQAKAKAAGGDVRIAGTNKVTKSLLETTNLTRVFGVFDSLRDAMESFQENG